LGEVVKLVEAAMKEIEAKRRSAADKLVDRAIQIMEKRSR
jgi:hypothetical protein